MLRTNIMHMRPEWCVRIAVCVCAAGLAAATVCGCVSQPAPTATPTATPTPAPDNSNANANASSDNGSTTAGALGSNLLYLLQPEHISLDDITAQPFRWIVIEPSRTGDAAGEFIAAEVQRMRSEGACDQRVILAYLSIGEAEDYRDYFDASWVDGEAGAPIEGVAPSWLGPSNPDFPGNYKVRYWEEGWQSLILGTASGPDATPLDRIINSGFDGVYLDIIDAYEFWSESGGGNELTRQEARERMIAWVSRIADYARQTRGAAGFLVFPQNGSDIIRDDDDAIDAFGESYLNTVDGIGIEDLFYDETTAQPQAETDYRIAQLAEFRNRGKAVLVTDYVLDTTLSPGASDTRVSDFYRRTLEEGFVPYAAVSDRDLNEIVLLEPPDWSVEQPVPCDE